MIYRGHVKNGVIVFDEADTSLPEGSAVDISPLPSETAGEPSEEIPTLFERLKPFIGKLEGLPPDASINHDHYLNGAKILS